MSTRKMTGSTARRSGLDSGSAMSEFFGLAISEGPEGWSDLLNIAQCCSDTESVLLKLSPFSEFLRLHAF